MDAILGTHLLGTRLAVPKRSPRVSPRPRDLHQAKGRGAEGMERRRGGVQPTRCPLPSGGADGEKRGNNTYNDNAKVTPSKRLSGDSWAALAASCWREGGRIGPRRPTPPMREPGAEAKPRWPWSSNIPYVQETHMAYPMVYAHIVVICRLSHYTSLCVFCISVTSSLSNLNCLYLNITCCLFEKPIGTLPTGHKLIS